jgi:hypothetical protein
MKAIIASVLVLGMSACSTAYEPPVISKQQSMSRSKASNAELEFRGTVQFVTLEGGFYAIYADDGRKFMPQKLSEAHEKHGLVVQVKGKIIKDVITFAQHGQVLKIISITVLDDSAISGKAIR